jgi:hypothetical protein
LVIGLCLLAALSSCGKETPAPSIPPPPAASDQPPVIGTVTPASGSGKTQAFTTTYSHPQGAKNILTTWFLVEKSLTGKNSCFVDYAVATEAVNLMDDGAQWQKALKAGSKATLSNSQCTVDISGVKAVIDGNNLSVTIPITFKPTYAGPKVIYMAALGAKSSATWTPKGQWTVQ